MADELLSDDALIAALSQPEMASDDAGSVKMPGVRDLLEIKKYSDRRKVSKRGPFVVTRAILGDAVGPLTSDGAS